MYRISVRAGVWSVVCDMQTCNAPAQGTAHFVAIRLQQIR